MSPGIAVIGTVLFGALDGGGAAAFVGAVDQALQVPAGFPVAALAVTWALPRHARA